jgi:uncharacterized membrane protein HdeD (DUF308 family)
MKNLLNKLKKFNTPLHYGIICVVFGIAFIALPYIYQPALEILVALAGLYVLFVGILTVAELDTTDRSIFYYLSVGKTLLLIGAGVFITVSRLQLARWLCLGYGIYILCRAVPTLVGLILLPKTNTKSWWVKFILSILQTILGTWLAIYPHWPSLYILAGVALTVIAVECFIKHKKKEAPAYIGHRVVGGTVYGADFEDKSDK